MAACKRTILPCGQAVNPSRLCAAIGSCRLMIRYTERSDCQTPTSRGPKVLLGEVSRRCYRGFEAPCINRQKDRRMGGERCNNDFRETKNDHNNCNITAGTHSSKLPTRHHRRGGPERYR